MSEALRQLYEWYRTAPESEVYTGWTQSGWIDARRGTRARELLAELVDLEDSIEPADAALARLCSDPVNPCLGFNKPEISIQVSRRKAGSAALLVKFTLADRNRAKKLSDRGLLPPSSTQFDLFGERQAAPETGQGALSGGQASKEDGFRDATLYGQSNEDRFRDATFEPACHAQSSEGRFRDATFEPACHGPVLNNQTPLLGVSSKNAPSSKGDCLEGGSSGPLGGTCSDVGGSDWHSADELDNLTIEADSFASGTVEETPVGGDEEAGWADWKVDASTWAKLPEEERQLILECDDWRYEDLEATFQGTEQPPEEEVGDTCQQDAVNEAIEAMGKKARSASAYVDPPETKDWSDVSQSVLLQTFQWVHQARQRPGQLLVSAPSPGTGKTFALVQAACDEQDNERRVIFAVFSKDQIPEVADRFRKAKTMVRLRVITGRDESNCWNYSAIEAAVASGYSPGSTVCVGCDSYPKNTGAPSEICPYYTTRLLATQEYRVARRMIPARFPIILTTHQGAVQAQRLARSRYGRFWAVNTVIFDEDPSAAFEKIDVIQSDHLNYRNPRDPKSELSALLAESIRIATYERQVAQARHWTSVTEPSESDAIHSPRGSTYVSTELHDLLEKSASSPMMAALARGKTKSARDLVRSILSQNADFAPAPGTLANLSAAQVAAAYPHRGLYTIAELLDREYWAVDADRASGANSRLSYQVRLELSGGEWQFVTHQYESYMVPNHTIIVGDAYARPDHYSAHLFPRYQTTVIQDVAHWPENAYLMRHLSRSSLSDIANSKEQFRTYLNAGVADVLRVQFGRSVLMYCHMAVKEWLTEWILETESRWGMKEWAIEHFGSGRGKDQYKDFDTFIAATEYIPNMGGLVHAANALYPGLARVEHWSGGKQRSGWQSFGHSISSMDERLRSVFDRKCVDELAQAIHRVRPAIPRPSGAPPKLMVVFGHHIPLNRELLSATSFARFPWSAENEGLYVDEKKGQRITSDSLTAFVNPEEMADAILSIYERMGYWSSSLGHVLTVDGADGLAQIDAAKQSNVFAEAQALITLLSCGLSKQSTLLDRVQHPPADWEDMSLRVRNSRTYKTAIEIASKRMPAPAQCSFGKRRASCWGDTKKFLLLMQGYLQPKTSEVPF